MKLSIVIPTYNSYAKTIKIIESLKKQDLTDTEIIIVNDCSTEKYGFFPKWINYIFLKENKGAVNARMQGWKNSIGKFIWFFDGDDEITNGSVKKIIDTLTNEDLHVFRMIKEKKSKKRYEFPVKISNNSSVGYSSYFGDKIFKSKVIKEDMFDLNSEIFQDENFLIRFGASINSVKVHKNVPPISCYLYNFGSISKNKTNFKQVMKLVNNVISLIDFIKTIPENTFKKKAKKQMTRMIVIAKGWSLKLKRKERIIIKNKIKEIKKNNKNCFNFLINYSIAEFFINLVSL